MKNKIALFAALPAMLSGCIMWDAGYTANKPVTRFSVANIDKFPITYSVSMISERGDVFALPDVKSLRANIEDALGNTGMFSEIHYGPKGGDDSYHVEFLFHQGGMNEEQSISVGMLAGCTLLLIPTGEVMTFDGTAVLSIKGQPIYSVAKAEELRCLIWLPMAPVGLFMNSWVVWNCVEKGTVNALCDAIAQEHKKRFLGNAKIQEAHRD